MLVSRMHNQSRNSGFTLVEMMIVVAIVGILSAFSLPAFNSWIADAQLKTVSEQFMSGIRLAQAEAVKSGQNVQFFITNQVPTAGVATNITGLNWGVQSLDPLNPANVDELLASAVIAGQYQQIDVTANTAVLTFNSIGRVTNIGQPGQIDVTHPEVSDRLRLIVSTTGAMRLCNPDKNRVDSPDGC